MKYFISIFALLFVALAAPLSAQIDPNTNKPWEQLTKAEAEILIGQMRTTVSDLEIKLDKLKADEQKAEEELKQIAQQLKDCEEALASLIGASKADIDAFRQRLGVLEGKVRDMEKLDNDVLADRRAEVEALEKEYLELRSSKIAILPEFYNRMVDLGARIKRLYREKKTSTYTVRSWYESKDCLWNIAERPEILGDANLWPKIWQANADQIKNPDLIFPGQVLQIPPKAAKTENEMKAERRYYRMKREAAGEAAPTAGE